MVELKTEILKDIEECTNKCKALNIHSTEYAFWNGCRCQAEHILAKVNNILLNKIP